MTRRARLAWLVVCLVPQFLARWLMFNKLGQRVKLPLSWGPYLFGRALGVDGSKCAIGPVATDQLALPRAETHRAA